MQYNINLNTIIAVIIITYVLIWIYNVSWANMYGNYEHYQNDQNMLDTNELSKDRTYRSRYSTQYTSIPEVVDAPIIKYTKEPIVSTDTVSTKTVAEAETTKMTRDEYEKLNKQCLEKMCHSFGHEQVGDWHPPRTDYSDLYYKTW